MEPKKKTSNTSKKAMPPSPIPPITDGNYSKKTMGIEEDKTKKDQETSWNTPRKKQHDYNKPAGSGSPIDSKKINDKKTGSSGKKNPHTRSSKERIY